MQAPPHDQTLCLQALGPDELTAGAQEAVNKLRRHSVQVCDVHRRLKDMELEQFKSMLISPELHPKGISGAHPSAASLPHNSSHHTSMSDLQRTHSEGEHNMTRRVSGAMGLAGAALRPATQGAGNHSQADLTDGDTFSRPVKAALVQHPAVEVKGKRLDRLYEAALVADRNAKLSIFSTRPAIYSPVCPMSEVDNVRMLCWSCIKL